MRWPAARTSPRCRRAGPCSCRSRWTTGTPRRTRWPRRTSWAAACPGLSGPAPDAMRALAERLAAARAPCARGGARPRLASAGHAAAVALAERAALPVWATPATGGGRLGFPEDHRGLPGSPPAGGGPAGETLAGHDLVLVVGLVGVPLLPEHPRAAAARRHGARGDHERPRRGRARPDGRRAGGRPDARRSRRCWPSSASRTPSAPPRAPGPGAARGVGPDERLGGGRGARRRVPRGRHRRARVAVEHDRGAQPPPPLAAGQLLLRRRRRARLRPGRVDRRPAGAARPAGRVRARRGLGPVRDPGASGPPPPTACRSSSSCCATRSTRS